MARKTQVKMKTKSVVLGKIEQELQETIFRNEVPHYLVPGWTHSIPLNQRKALGNLITKTFKKYKGV